MAQRLVYAPRVIAYIKTEKEILNISEDIISGSVTRRTNAVSSATLKLQNRNKFYNGRFKPMDKIVIYLQKVKPILVFSGYLDSVPYLQPVPGPITINCSCTLKLLEFTYFDPGLPTVQAMMARFVGAGDDFAAIPDGGNNQFAFLDSRQQGADGVVEETGYGRMLLWLIHTVGKWPMSKIHVLQIPQPWINMAIEMLNRIQEDGSVDSALGAKIVSQLLTANGVSTSAGGVPGIPSVTTTALTATEEEMVKKINEVIKKRRPNAPYNGYGKIFVTQGLKNGIDPRFMAAITGAESSFGSDGSAQATHNGFGDLSAWGYGHDQVGSGGLRVYPSWESGIIDLGRHLKEAYTDSGIVTITAIRNKWAPAGASNDPSNLNANWVGNVSTIMREMGGDPNGSVKLTNVTVAQPRARQDPDAPSPSNPPSNVPEGQSGSPAADAEGPPQTTQLTPSRSPANQGQPSQSGEPTTSTNTAPQSSGGGKFSVYIEAGHSSPRLSGYTGQTGATGGWGGDEVVMNIKLAKAVEDILRNSSDVSVMATNGATPSGKNPDIFVAIHHDNNISAIAYPSSFSVSTAGDIDADGKSHPNKYSNNGSYIDPTTVGGRLNISTNEPLKANSKKLGDALSNSLGKPIADSGQNRMWNYYSFYYSNGKACAIIELPNLQSYSVATVAQQIATGIGNYINNNPTAGGGGGDGGTASGDDSAASKLITVLKRTAMKNNNGAGSGILDYSSPGRRGVSLKVAEDANDAMDCSGFVSNGMIEIGVEADGFSLATGGFISRDTYVDKSVANSLKPGMFLIEGVAGGSGSSEHIGVFCGNDEVVHCSGGGKGPNIVKYSTSYFKGADFKAYVDPKVGTTDNPPGTIGTTVSPATAGQVFSSSQALDAIFNFPGNPIESIFLTGQRALENDVKLLEIVDSIAKASMRSYASHPTGDFMAWFPDYFNASGKTPYLVISDNEIMNCTIELSDNNLATHVYVAGDILGANAIGTSQISDLLEKLTTGKYGVVTIQQAYMLDTFLTKTTQHQKLLEQFKMGDKLDSLTAAQRKQFQKDKRSRVELLGPEVLSAFLSRYGGRPYSVNNPPIRHPYLLFFIAYQTFQLKWAEQFASEASFTFMPELFPGTIVKFKSLGVNFYCDEVTHSFDYTSGFTTSANLIAPSTDADSGHNFGLALSSPPFKIGSDDDLSGIKVIAPKTTKPSTVIATNKRKGFVLTPGGPRVGTG